MGRAVLLLQERAHCFFLRDPGLFVFIFQCPYHRPSNRGPEPPSPCAQPADPKFSQRPPDRINSRVHFSFPNVWFPNPWSERDPEMESLFSDIRRDLRRAHLIQDLESGK